ncbi:tRNA 4-thiouridine(8) synthase ThiI [Paenibacillus sp. 598K]|uniref:tRNA uracil 4-sulfurtransferase ThiI n=1 Tax=Paenibacillus sp. 598K TaxID=1117987 RepID=UPI000FF96D81|nr:tRNA uracil 4-sulfurtransferase ThiI [Paenibacillus sp. 598K]GBF75446.1 tRNA 4-thiouridine(8) synthase ThiI [Paenibacillus sp. 598K]
MTYDILILRFGEFTLKGKNRSRFEKRMMEHVSQAVKGFPNLEARCVFGRIYVVLNGQAHEEVIERLRDVFGIVSISPALSTQPELEAIREAGATVIAAQRTKEQTFKTSVRRVWKAFPHTSQEMNHLVGGYVLRLHPQLKVDVHSPDLELRVEIQQEAALVYCETIRTAGGFPYGTNGKAMLLLSGGIDSPVAGWHAMRRGLEVEAVHFYSYPYTSEQARDKVIALASRLSGFAGGRLRLHLVPFTELQTSFAQMKQDPLIITMMRRAMLRISDQLARQHGALAIVTGDSLGQVASQTLGSMHVIGQVTTLPLLRPLVMMDKQEIIDRAQAIGTYDVSILPYEDCCTLFVPRSPSTNPNLRVVEKVESFVTDYDRLVEEAVAATETMVLTPDHAVRLASASEEAWF